MSLTDRFGKFTIDQLPHDKTYRAEFTYQGYQTLTKEFSLNKDQKLDFGKLYLQRQINEIEEVVVLPPVRMSGDTIEFNADAFQLDTNAVIEDLIHKLPGMIVWGDGKITYQGKEIPSVLINGKEFFGSDKSIGLQNIPKDIVKKIQVYDTRDKLSQKMNPSDANYEMNVVLKEGKEKMVFGNITAGIGTDKRQENYLNMNYASKRAQYSLGYTANNTNKKLNNLNQLLKNTTYKGVGIHADYQSDFDRTGINRQHAIATRYQYDFLGTNEANRKNIITGNIFGNWDKENITNTANTVVTNNSTDYLDTRIQESESIADNKNLKGDLKYNIIKEVKGRLIRVNAAFNLSTFNRDKQQSSVTQYDYSNNQSSNTKQDQQYVTNKSLGVNFSVNWGSKNLSYIYQKSENRRIMDKLGYELTWDASVSDNHSLNNSNTQIENHITPAANREINRLYGEDYMGNSQQIAFVVSNQNFRITNSVQYRYSKTDREVSNLGDGTKHINTSLSHLSNFRQLTYTPRITCIYPILDKNYIGRFSENISLKPELALRLLNRNNVSTLGYRNIKQNFVSYLPKVGLEYVYNKYGAYLFTSGVGYQYSEDFPVIDQLRPIYDDNNPSYRYFGNPDLSETKKHKFNGMIRFQEHKSQSLMVNYNTAYSVHYNAIRDSIVFAPDQQQVYAVNIANGMYNFDIGINISKPLVIKRNQTLTFEINASSYWSKDYQYINAELQELAPTNQHVNFITYYTNADKYQISWKGSYNQYNSRNLTSLDHTFLSNEYSTGLSVSYAMTKKMKIGSNADSRFIVSNRVDDRLTIWNANVAYRFTKGNDLEAKLAVYDILNQNKGIYIHNGATEFTSGYRNNLNQFFLFTISYFPRKFGL